MLIKDFDTLTSFVESIATGYFGYRLELDVVNGFLVAKEYMGDEEDPPIHAAYVTLDTPELYAHIDYDLIKAYGEDQLKELRYMENLDIRDIREILEYIWEYMTDMGL